MAHELLRIALALTALLMFGACATTPVEPIVAGRLFAHPEPLDDDGPLAGWTIEAVATSGEAIDLGSEFADSPGWYFVGGMQAQVETLVRFRPPTDDVVLSEGPATAVVGEVPAALLWVDDGVFHAWTSTVVDDWLSHADAACGEQSEPEGCRAELGTVEPSDWEQEELSLLVLGGEDQARDPRLNGEAGLRFNQQDLPEPSDANKGDKGAWLFGPLPAGDVVLEFFVDGRATQVRRIRLLPATITSIWSPPPS